MEEFSYATITAQKLFVYTYIYIQPLQQGINLNQYTAPTSETEVN